MIAIIPAHLGSKRIRHKNMVKLGKYPLITWTIKAALESKLITKICIVTDDPAVKILVRKIKDDRWNILETSRPKVASPGEVIIRDVLDMFPNKYIVYMQCTSPFREKGIIDEALLKISRMHADSLYFGYPVTKWLWKDNKPINYDYKKRILTQDKKWDIMIECGDYMFTRKLFEKTGCRLGGKVICQEVDRRSSLDINDYTDLKLARSMI